MFAQMLFILAKALKRKTEKKFARENKVDRAAREFMCANITFFNQVRLDFEDFCSNQRHTRKMERKILSIAMGFSFFWTLVQANRCFS